MNDESQEEAEESAVNNDATSDNPLATNSLQASKAKFMLTRALKQLHAPHVLCRARRAGHTSYEYLQSSEGAFWRLLDFPWATHSFRSEMTSILRANDQAYFRNNYERLLSGIRPTERFNPYECHDPDVLTVPRSYKRLKYVQDLDALLQTTNYLQSLPGFKWTALSIIRCNSPKGDETYNACETIQFATANESFVIDARMCKTVVATEVLCRFLTLLFTTGTRFGFCFDEADREQIAALVDGNSLAEMMCRTTIRHSLVYDARQLMDKLHENLEDNANEIDGLARALELPDYVRNLPRLSHYVHHITKKKLNKAYACWLWSSRPYLDEQLAYAHTDVICVIVLLQRCSKMSALRTAMKTLFGEEALREIDLDLANIYN